MPTHDLLLLGPPPPFPYEGLGSVPPPFWLLLLDPPPDLVGPESTADFWTSLYAWFSGDPVMRAVFPGGMVNARAAPRNVYPYVRTTDVEPQEPLSDDDWPMRVTLSVYALGADDKAVGLLKYLADRLDDTLNRNPIAYGPWTESGHMTVGATDVTDLGPGPGGLQNVWRADLEFLFYVTSVPPLTLDPTM